VTEDDAGDGAYGACDTEGGAPSITRVGPEGYEAVPRGVKVKVPDGGFAVSRRQTPVTARLTPRSRRPSRPATFPLVRNPAVFFTDHVGAIV
jgi:hypothetical protein